MFRSRTLSFVCGTAVACAAACGASNAGGGGATQNSSAGNTMTSQGGASSNAGSSGVPVSGGAMNGLAGAAQAGTSSAAAGNSAQGGAANGGSANGGASNGGASNGGAPHGGAAQGGAANGGTAQGGAANGGKAGADTGPYPDITLAGLTTAVELAPVRLAANGIYPAKVTVTSGGVDNLFGSNPALVATNAETQALRSSVQHENLRIIFTVCEGLYRIVAKKSAGINTLADLKGKTIDYSSGTSSAYFLHQMLGLVNLTESDVKTG
ncbi:MAG TPA: ABC transporter substrate-binding protein, partial [Polyangiaceae bacterium]